MKQEKYRAFLDYNTNKYKSFIFLNMVLITLYH